ncbi:Allergen V5/Tpx-1 related [Brucella melitensis]|nr:Allergen V5/Tpx-1 related [Brucella melitensis]
MQQKHGIRLSRRGFLMLAGGAMGSLPAVDWAQAEVITTNRNLQRYRKATACPDGDRFPLEQAVFTRPDAWPVMAVGHSVGWGNGFVSRLKQAGIRACRRNVAVGQPDTQAVFDAWMNHRPRKNMLDPTLPIMALLGDAESNPRRIYWAMMLGL